MLKVQTEGETRRALPGRRLAALAPAKTPVNAADQMGPIQNSKDMIMTDTASDPSTLGRRAFLWSTAVAAAASPISLF